MTGVQFDTSGNQTAYDGLTLGYDAESRNTSVTGSGASMTFSYDGEGRRVKKAVTPSGSPAVTTYYIYNALGQLAAEQPGQPPISTGTTWMFTDMLGSVRAIASDAGTVLECYDYLPFGRMLSSGDNGRSALGCYPADPDTTLNSRAPQKFTGKERDAETGLDYFLARYGERESVERGERGHPLSATQGCGILLSRIFLRKSPGIVPKSRRSTSIPASGWTLWGSCLAEEQQSKQS